MRLGSIHVASSAVGHRERIVETRRPRLQRKSFLQVLHGSDVILSAERRASRAGPRRRRVGLERQGLREQRLGGFWTALIEIHVAERDKSRDIVWLQLKSPFKRRRGLRERSPDLVQ